MKRHTLPLAAVAVWLVILLAWLMMGGCVSKRTIVERDTLYHFTHDTVTTYINRFHTDTLRITDREVVTLRETGDTLHIIKYVDRVNTITRNETVYVDKIKTDTAMASTSHTEKVVKRAPWWGMYGIPVLFLLCGFIFMFVCSNTKNKK